MIPLKDNVLAGGFPAVTVGLIVLCLVGFCWQLTLSGAAGTGEAGVSERDELALTYGTSPERISDGGSAVGWAGEPPGLLTPLTAIPIAADLLHLVVGLLFMLIFGRTVEARIGPLAFAALVVVAALAGACAQALADPGAVELVIGIGAALSGVLGAYAVLHPRAGVVSLTLIPFVSTLIEVPVLALIGAWFLLALVPTLSAMVDPDLLVGAGLELVGYAGAFAAGAAAGLLARNRPLPVTGAAS